LRATNSVAKTNGHTNAELAFCNQKGEEEQDKTSTWSFGDSSDFDDTSTDRGRFDTLDSVDGRLFEFRQNPAPHHQVVADRQAE
jgi:hypothetical protein